MAATTAQVCMSFTSAELRADVERIASSTDRPVRALWLQALIQGPQLADSSGFAPRSQVERLLLELASELPPAKDWSVASIAGSSPRSLRFEELDLTQARELMKRFHYLRSPRVDGRVYGLTASGGRIIALAVSSPVDVPALIDVLVHRQRRPERARVLSRVFVFDHAPRNTISYLLARVSRAEKQFGISDWITYVNPNIGFTGVSYIASGWHLLGEESSTTYRYLDQRYITDRELAAKFGFQDDLAYERLLANRFAKTKMRLLPLKLFGTHGKLKLQTALPLQSQFTQTHSSAPT